MNHIAVKRLLVVAFSALTSLSLPAAADITVIDRTALTDGAHEASLPGEQGLEAVGGEVLFNLQIGYEQGPRYELDAELLVDTLALDDGLTRVEVGASVQMGSRSGRAALTVSGAGASVEVNQDVLITDGSTVQVRDGGELAIGGSIIQQWGGRTDETVRVLAQGAGSIIKGLEPSYYLGPDGSLRTERSGVLGLGEHGMSTLEVEVSEGAVLAGYHRVVIAGNKGTIDFDSGAKLLQLEPTEEGVVPGLIIHTGTDPVLPPRKLTVSFSGEGTGAEILDGIRIDHSNGGPVEVLVTDGAHVSAGRVLQLGGVERAIPDAAYSGTTLEVARGGRVSAEMARIRPRAVLRAGAGVGNLVAADVVLERGAVDVSAGSIKIEGDLNVGDGTIILGDARPGAGLEVAGETRFDEPSLIRFLVSSVPLGNEILLDDYLDSTAYTAAPSFMLEHALEVVEAEPGILTGSEILFRFQALGQSYRFEGPPARVPELDRGGALAALALLAGLWRIRRERGRS